MTFSIVARCKKTGMLGMAVSTARPAVGSLAVYVKARVGAIATQAAVNPYFGINGLTYLEQGLSAEEVMEKVKSEDLEFEKRQLAIVDNEGRTAGYTGTETVPWAGHYFGDEFVVVGNMLVGEQVIKAMAETYETSKIDYLPLRLLATIKAGQEAGGDKRGKQSAALKVCDTQSYPIVDIRADEHENPIDELERIYEAANINLFPYIENLPVYDQDKKI
ncbi:DUF1028 domain-containing protein [Pseudogracilibacillus sp. SE30717A]|uniref:DUF1028 domain-containing protein n=1 Tax=Pseudogracilibacillus sp. SE30717A TaxID=3098293 RepID=UPI00300E2658